MMKEYSFGPFEVVSGPNGASILFDLARFLPKVKSNPFIGLWKNDQKFTLDLGINDFEGGIVYHRDTPENKSRPQFEMGWDRGGQ